MSYKKQIIKDSVFKKYWEGVKAYFTLSELDFEILPTDLLDYESDWDENWSSLTVYREREETDDEFNARIQTYENMKATSKKMRYEQYLKLKEEFENGKPD